MSKSKSKLEDPSRIKRLEMRLGMLVQGMETSWIEIVEPDSTSHLLARSFPLKLPIDIANFIHTYCKCKFCGRPIASDLRRCSCGEPNIDGRHLWAECTHDNFENILKPILDREGNRVRRARRQQRLEANGGSYTQQEIAELYEIQEGICYFCGTPISKKSRQNRMHIDHYEPVLLGGTNDISNLVLTCAACNLDKGAFDGDVYESYARKKRHPDVGRRLGKIRRKRNQYLAKRSD